MAELFFNDRHPILCGLGLLTSKYTSFDHFSNTEKMRILRGICRYTIYGDIFWDEDRFDAHKYSFISAYDQSHIFITSLPAYEIEELSTINEFIAKKIMQK